MKRFIVLALWLGPSTAGGSPPAAVRASALHQRAVTLFKRGRTKDVVEAEKLWREAEALHQDWKYPANIALTLLYRKQWLAAFAATQRAIRFGAPAPAVTSGVIAPGIWLHRNSGCEL